MKEPEERTARHGLLLTITGNGKGKTTSALGNVVRALGWGWQVGVLQFVKDERETGERRFFRELRHPGLSFLQVGRGMSWQPGDHAAAARHGWELALDALYSGRFDLVVLDELNIALHYHWLETAAVVAALRERPAWLHVIVTGRHAPPELLEISDLVSEIREIRHPFQQGIAAQAGIDY